MFAFAVGGEETAGLGFEEELQLAGEGIEFLLNVRRTDEVAVGDAEHFESVSHFPDVRRKRNGKRSHAGLFEEGIEAAHRGERFDDRDIQKRHGFFDKARGKAEAAIARINNDAAYAADVFIYSFDAIACACGNF